MDARSPILHPIGKPITPLCASCQKPMVDSVIADLGHRFECTACKAICLRRNDLSNLTLSREDLPDTPWGDSSPSLMSCPICPVVKLTEIFYSKEFPEPLYHCQNCKGLVLSHESLGRIRRFRLKMEAKEADISWLDPKAGVVPLLAFPACMALSWLADLLVLPAVLLKGIDMQFHEFGHALFSWLSGTPAIPMAVVTIPFPIPKVVAFGIFALSLFFWGNKGRQEKLHGFTGFFFGLLLLQIYLTFVAPKQTTDMLVVFGGILGQYLIPLVLGLAYFYDLPKFWNWNVMKYAVLFVALYSVEHNAEYWSNIVKGKIPLPYGSIVGGVADSNGDLNRLINEFGWTESYLTRLMNILGIVCRLTLWGHFVTLLFKKMQKS